MYMVKNQQLDYVGTEGEAEFSRVILDDDKENVLVGGPDSDYNSLLGNMEAWNIINFKLEVTNASLSKQRRTLRIMEFLVDKLNDVLID